MSEHKAEGSDSNPSGGEDLPLPATPPPTLRSEVPPQTPGGPQTSGGPEAPGGPEQAPFLYSGMLLVGCTFLNLVFFAIARSLESPAIIGFLAGMVVAEMGVLATWAVFAPLPLYVRWPLGLTAVVFLFGVGVVGIVIAESTSWRSSGVREVGRFVFLLPLVWLAVQVPFWIVRMATRMRLVRPDESRGQRETLQIQHLLMGTVLVAVCFGLARAAGNTERDFWLYLAATCGFFLLGGVLVLPAFWAVFRTDRLVAGAALVLLYAGLLGAVTVTLFGAFAPGMPAEAAFAIVSFHGGVGVMMLAGLLALRAGGYQLKRPGEL